jgi:NAD(P)-dependent dehydrogenase (short-subunit alcohol dehydrogenase family)
MTLRFQEEHLHRFSAASLDFNPLHLSQLYAHKTSSGERVVYGILGFLACLRDIPLPEGQVLSAVRIDFKGPMSLGVDYTVAAEPDTSGNLRVLMMDGSATVMRARLQFRTGKPEMAVLPELGVAPLVKARRLQAADFQPGLSFRGVYSPGRTEYLALLDLLELDRALWGDALPIAALCSSYVTGMEMPGECATYSGLRLQLEPGPIGPVEFQIKLGSFDDHFGLAQSQFSISSHSRTLAQGEIAAIARAPQRRTRVVDLGGNSSGFAGKTALLIGASRGLGAAMALDLVAEGGTVVGVYAQSQDEAGELLRASKNLPGRLIMERGDASDLNWCAALKNRVIAEFGRIDLLICSAAPALQPLRVEAACYERMRIYLDKGFALLAAPLSTFLGSVAACSGCVLAISSIFVEDPPEIWPHYVSLKAVVEGLVGSAAAGSPKVRFWIARPGKILTDLTNTPLGRLNAEEPHAVSGRILERALSQAAPGTVHYCH